MVFEVRLVTAEDELPLKKLDSPVDVKIPVERASLEDGQKLQVSKCGTWSEMKEYFLYTDGLLWILTGKNDANPCRPYGLGIRCSASLSNILCFRLAVPSSV